MADLLALGFGQGPTMAPHHRAAWEAVVELDRTLVVEDEGRIVGTGMAHSLGVAPPGGRRWRVSASGGLAHAPSVVASAALLDAPHRRPSGRAGGG